MYIFTVCFFFFFFFFGRVVNRVLYLRWLLRESRLREREREKLFVNWSINLRRRVVLKLRGARYIKKNLLRRSRRLELIFSFLSVWRWRAALELSRGRRWRRWCRAVRSTRERPGCTWPPSQSPPRGHGARAPSVSTAPATATPTRSRGGGRGCSIRGTRCPQTRQGRDLRVSSFLFFLSPPYSFHN